MTPTKAMYTAFSVPSPRAGQVRANYKLVACKWYRAFGMLNVSMFWKGVCVFKLAMKGRS